MSEAELKESINKRKQIKASLTRFQKYVENFDNNDVDELKIRFERAKLLLSDYESIASKIEYLDSESDHSLDYEEFESKYYKVITSAKKIIEFRFESIAASANISGTHDNHLNTLVKLPTINLPEFNGKYDGWMNFYDTFDALVNKNYSLTHVQRFYYLKSALSGDAANLLNSLEVSESNYIVAWNLLKERYENKKLIINTHVKGIFDMPSIIKGSHKSLRLLLDTFLKHIRSLQNLDLPTDKWDVLLIHIITNKLDNQTKHEWEKMTINKSDLPTTSELIKFLTERCQILETISSDNNQHANQIQKNICRKSYVSLLLLQKNHFLYHCPDFLKLTVQNRWSEIKDCNYARIAFDQIILIRNVEQLVVKKCNKNHNTLLHNDSYNKAEQSKLDSNASSSKEDSIIVSKNEQIPTQSYLASTTIKPSEVIKIHRYEPQVILSTAQITIMDNKGNNIICRALLDSGSQSNFITYDLVKKLDLRTENIRMPVTGINQAVSYLTHKTNARVNSINNNFNCDVSFLVLKNITGNVPNLNLDISNLDIPQDIKLADEQFHTAGRIDILFGAGIFWNLLCIGQIRVNNSVTLQKTRLGWIVAGFIPQPGNYITTLHTTSLSMQDQLERFWKIEECVRDREYNNEELICEQHFVKNFKRDSKGRFQVKLPMRREDLEFGDSVDIAIKRFYVLENRFKRDANFKEKYLEFMTEYEKLGHMSEIQDFDNQPKSIFYLPHHGVLKESSLTTKLRVVFDASVKGFAGESLNDRLYVGPNIQDDLLYIILRFRKYNYVLTADIAKMYRQINVEISQRDLQRIVWRNNSLEPLRHYRLNTLTYGTAPASFLATRCLKQLALEHIDAFPIASNAILHDFYMDDLITGAETIEEAAKLKFEISAILESAGMELRQWSTNKKLIFNDDNIKYKVDKYYISDKQSIKTLGLFWDAEKTH